MVDPFSGKIIDGKEFGVSGKVVYGRGTNGQKASLAAMIHAAQTVLNLQVPLRRGFAINAGVMEECGGHLAPQYLMERDQLPVFSVLCGEHTDLRPVVGQRGMIHIQLEIRGKGAHAASPEGASSALSGMAKVILALDRLRENLPEDEALGKALVSLNKLSVVPNVVNIIPDRCDAVVDVRHPASATREEIVAIVKSCIAEAVASQEGLVHTAEVKKLRVTSYTGLEEWSDGCMFPFFTPKDNPLVVALVDSVKEMCGVAPEPELWKISSEAGYFSAVCGFPVVAFGPGEDRFTHNRNEHVKVEDVIITTKVYASVILKMCL
jgi:acetylornithine deacetylase/succinyl-diaminopimelate desuccinylase-like protein